MSVVKGAALMAALAAASASAQITRTEHEVDWTIATDCSATKTEFSSTQFGELACEIAQRPAPKAIEPECRPRLFKPVGTPKVGISACLSSSRHRFPPHSRFQ